MPARDYGYQLVHYCRKGIVFNDHGLTVPIGTLPINAVVLRQISGVNIHTAFNSGVANTLNIGASTDSGTNNFATDLALGSVGWVVLDENPTALLTVETTMVGLVACSAATAGAAEILIAYAPDNDM